MIIGVQAKKRSVLSESACILLDILSVAPLLMILGNILPPFILKVHQIGFGIAFLLTLLILGYYKQGQVFLLFMVGFTALQGAVYRSLDIVQVFDFYFGPAVLLCIILLIRNDVISRSQFRTRRIRFFWMAFIPIGIALLQYFEVIPVQFLNATYINYSSIAGDHIERVNGFFYHGNELVVLSFFTFLNLAYGKSSGRAVFWLSLLIVFSFMTLYKALIFSAILLLIVYVLWINKVGAQVLKTIPRWGYVLGVFVAVIGLFLWMKGFIHQNFETYGLPFRREMLTGRGGIWTVYLYAIENYSWFNHLIGTGIGSEVEQFEMYMTPEAYYPLQADPDTDLRPHAHNPWLGIYINTGIIGILFIINALRNWWTQFKATKPATIETAFACSLLILPFITYGITIYITDMAILWICLGFTLVNVQYKQAIISP